MANTNVDWSDVMLGIAKDHIISNKLLILAIKQGKLDVIQSAHENNIPWHDKTTYLAALFKQFEILKYAFENGCPWDENTTWAAAASEDLNILKYVHQNGCPWSLITFNAAANNINIFKYVLTNRTLDDFDEGMMIYDVLKSGNLEVVQYLVEQGYNMKGCVGTAASYGHLHVIKYFMNNGFTWDEDTTVEAARNGHQHVIIYAKENGYYIHPDTNRYVKNEK
jgi:hypothetical protein